MALDAALLAALLDDAATMPIIRIYQWKRTSVSFGRLQSEVAVGNYYPNLPRIRRPTGGRAVLHGEDITVSVAMLTTYLPAHCKSGMLGAYRQIFRRACAGLKGGGG